MHRRRCCLAPDEHNGSKWQLSRVKREGRWVGGAHVDSVKVPLIDTPNQPTHPPTKERRSGGKSAQLSPRRSAPLRTQMAPKGAGSATGRFQGGEGGAERERERDAAVPI